MMRRILTGFVLGAAIAAGTAVSAQTTDPLATIWQVLAFLQAEIEYVYAQIRPGPVVVDAGGSEIGIYAAHPVYEDVALRNESGVWVRIPVRRDGFIPEAVYYLDSQCAGPEYVLADGSAGPDHLTRVGWVNGSLLRYAGDPTVVAPAYVQTPLGCQLNTRGIDGLLRVGPAVAIDLSAHGFAAPFSVR